MANTVKHYYKYFLVTILLLIGCEMRSKSIHHIEKHTIVKIFRINPTSVHEQISPRIRAILSNGDTVPCTNYRQVGDTITYIYYDDRPTNSRNPL